MLILSLLVLRHHDAAAGPAAETGRAGSPGRRPPAGIAPKPPDAELVTMAAMQAR